MRRVFSLALLGSVLATSLLATATSAATPPVIYENMPDPVPGNVPSKAFQAQTVGEVGDRVAFEPATSRSLDSVEVLMSSWACESGGAYSSDCVTSAGATFSHPITLNIHSVGAGASVGSLLGTVTETFAIPYRPSADDTNCVGPNDGKWFDGTACFNGFATPITFDLSSLNLTAPDEVIISVAYNTSNYGHSPIGTAACQSEPGGCGYDSLNVALSSTSNVGVGSNPAPSDAYLYAAAAGNVGYCSATDGLNVFRLDGSCWSSIGKPAMTVFAAGDPDISLTPASNDFGSVTQGTTSAPATFTVENTGMDDLNVTGVSLDGTNPSQFAIDTNNCDAEVLAPTETCTVDVVFKPTSTGAKSARLEVDSNDPDTASISAVLTGTGVAAPSNSGNITIILDSHPDGAQQFSFTGTNGIAPFTLTDDGTPANTATFTKPAGLYTFRVGAVSKWALSALTCNTHETILRSHGLVQIQLQAGENVVCTFTESNRIADASIGLTSAGAYVGDNVYTINAQPSQSLSQSMLPGETRSFFVRLQNDGVDSDTFKLASKLKGSLKYDVWFLTGNVDVTGKVKAGTYRVTLAPGATRTIEIRVKAQAGLGANDLRKIILTQSSTSAPAAKDVVRAIVDSSL